MDTKVYETQRWLNATYSGNSAYAQITEDGMTGTQTCKALIRALQIELGVTVDGVWGDETTAAFKSLSMESDSSNTSISNQIRILQGGLYCKGQNLNPVYLNGEYTEETEAAVKKFEEYAGLTTQTGVASAMIMEALLNTDAYTLLSNGDSNIRTIQQALNNNYHSEIGLIPCDGVYSRRTCRALISGLQYEERKEYSNTVVDGIWGEVTMNRCPTLQRYGTVTNKQYVYILQYALYANGFDPNGFDGGFGAGVQSAVKSFQAYCALTSDGIVGRSTWASLMVSYGDQSRVGTACDCKKPLTADTAALIVNDGRTVVGRYLTGGINKRLSASEIEVIYNAGLKIMPIYQTTGNKASYFKESKGTADAFNAYSALTEFGFPEGTTVYFAVDYDATEDEAQSNIIPYFQAINEAFAAINEHSYKIGIYAPRYICTLVRQAGYSTSSFVCDMSSGFLCNIGHKLPEDWAYDQISTDDLGSGTVTLEIDNDIASSRATASVVNPNNEFVLSDSDYETAQAAKIQKILDAHNIELNGFSMGMDKEQDIFAYSTGFVTVKYTIGEKLSSNSGAIALSMTSNVKNGSYTDASFTAEIENIFGSMSLGTNSENCIDFNSLAAAVNTGRVTVEVNANSSSGIFEISVISEVGEIGTDEFTTEYYVKVTYIININEARPEAVPESTYNEVVNAISGVDTQEITNRRTIIILVLIAFVLCLILIPGLAAALCAIIPEILLLL